MNDPAAREVTMGEWAQRREPNLTISSKSEPDPVLLRYNLVAVLDDSADSRDLLLKWERIQPAAAGVGFVAMTGTANPDGPDAYQAPAGQGPVATTDAQRVSGHAGRRILRGALPGLVIGAVVVGLITLALGVGTAGVIGAALGGAAFGLVAGGVASFVAGTGWSEAYKESFVDPAVTDVVFASIHSDDADMIVQAAQVADLPGEQLLSVDRIGQPAPLHRGDRSTGAH